MGVRTETKGCCALRSAFPVSKWAVVRATESQDHKVYVGLRSFMTDLALLSTSTCDSLDGITMNFLQSRPSTFRESLPSIFDAKKQAWPNREASLGDECQSIGRVKCWQAVGPALELKGNLTHSLQELLNNHRDSLEQGEPKPRAISFSI